MKKFKKIFFAFFASILMLISNAVSFKCLQTKSVEPGAKPKVESKVYFCTYGDEKFKQSRQRIADEAKKLKCFDGIHIFTPEKLSKNFKSKYKDILAQKRGGG